MKAKWVLILLAAVALMALAPRQASACTCMWGGPFLKVAPGSKLIIRGQVLRHTGVGGPGTPTEMEVRVLETLSGPAPGDTIVVSGDNGVLCRPYVSAFPVGTEWVFALSSSFKPSKEQPGSHFFQDKGDYAISVCGAYWLKVEGESVSGNISDSRHSQARQSMTLEELRRRLARKEVAPPRRPARRRRASR